MSTMCTVLRGSKGSGPELSTNSETGQRGLGAPSIGVTPYGTPLREAYRAMYTLCTPLREA